MTHTVTPSGFLLALSLAGSVIESNTQAQSSKPPPLTTGVRIEQRVGVKLPLDVTFRDAHGKPVRLGSLLGNRPAVLAFVYYECPMLCTRVLDGLVRSLRALSFDVGKQFDVVILSIDPREDPELALVKKVQSVERYGRPSTSAGWHFLTGGEKAIRSLADEAGFRYRYDPQSGQYAHAAGIVVLTPEGRTARYLLGIDYPPRTLRLSLVEASKGKVGSVVDDLFLLCFEWDPTRGKYGFVVMSALRVAGLVTVVALAALIVVLFVRERRKQRQAEGTRQ